MLRSGLKNWCWWFIILCCSLLTYVHAETVVLVEGDTIQGEVTKETDTSIIVDQKVLGELDIPKDQISGITVVHDVLGEIRISLDQILPLAASKPEVETVILIDGDVVHGKIAKKTDSTLILVHEVFGELEIPKDQIASIIIVHDVLGGIAIPAGRIASVTGEPKSGSPEIKMPSGKKEPQQRTEKEDDLWFEPEFDRLNNLAARLKKSKWSVAIDFSMDTTSGSQEEEAARLGAHIRRNLPRETLAIDTSYYHKISEGRVTDNKLTLGGLKDWLMPGSKWFFFEAGRYDYDEFESWRQRANIQVGPGYSLINSDDVLLNFRLGAGGRKEWGSQNSDLKFEGLAGLDLNWKLTKKQIFETSIWLFPVLTDFDDYRTRTTVNWRYHLSKELNLGLLVGLLHESQSIVDPDSNKNDTRVYTGIQFKF